MVKERKQASGHRFAHTNELWTQFKVDHKPRMNSSRLVQAQALALITIIITGTIAIAIATPSPSSFETTPPPLAPDVTTLLTLKAALDPDSSNPALATWTPAIPLCLWRGLTFSYAASYPFNCEEQSYTLTFTLAFDATAVATALVLPSANLTGTLSPAIANLFSLKTLVLSNNHLLGATPSSLGNLPSLTLLDLHNNNFTGPIPPSLFNLCRNPRFTTLLLHGNRLTGSIPFPLGGVGITCPSLASFTVGHNNLSGRIPGWLSNFVNLTWLDLSYNRFTYVIPMGFVNLTRLGTGVERGFSVAGNELMGPIPGFKQSFSARAFEGNSKGLCGAPLERVCVRDVSVKKVHRRRKGMGEGEVVVVGVSVAAVAVVLVYYGVLQGVTLGMCALLFKKLGVVRTGRKPEEVRTFPKGKLVQFYEHGGDGLTEDVVLKAASELLEETSYGQHYRAWLPNSHMLSLSLFKDEIARDEPEFLRGVLRLAVVKHPNLVPLRAYYLSRKNEKLLIYDHVVGRTLADIIHGECTLNWQQRHKLALAVAHGVAHLHLEPSVPLVHANLKSSNILVDEHHNAILTSYGLHLLVTPAATNSIITDAADEGYRAPELRKSKKTSTHTDVFSYGIVLLEILTGQKPGKVLGSDTVVALPELVKAAILEERLCDVLDLELLKPSICMPAENGILEALKLAMGCCAPSPSLRPNIGEVVQKLEGIQSKFMIYDTASAIRSPQHINP